MSDEEDEEFAGTLIAVFPLHGETKNTFRYSISTAVGAELLANGEMIGSIYVPKLALPVLTQDGERPESLLVIVQPES